MPRPTKQDKQLARQINAMVKPTEVSSEEEEDQQMDFSGEGEEGDNFFFGGEEGEGSLLDLYRQMLMMQGEEGEFDMPFDFGEGEGADATGGFDFSSVREDIDELNTMGDEKVKKALAVEASAPVKKIDPKKLLSEQNMDFYEILGVDRACEDQAIIKAYKKLALQFHPDRNVDKTKAEKKLSEQNFAYLGKIYQTLLDPRRRQFYDKHGELSGNDMSDGFLDAYELWKKEFPGITVDEREVFKAQYLDSEEEYQDVINAFNETNGDLFTMMTEILFFSELETYERDRDMVLDLIAKGRITNQAAIDNFNATHTQALEKLRERADKEEKLYDQFNQLAHQRALKKSKNGQVTKEAIEYELVSLVNQHNRSKKSSDMMESIAMALMANPKEQNKADHQTNPKKRKK